VVNIVCAGVEEWRVLGMKQTYLDLAALQKTLGRMLEVFGCKVCTHYLKIEHVSVVSFVILMESLALDHPLMINFWFWTLALLQVPHSASSVLHL
jgi:hypothetical protein